MLGMILIFVNRVRTTLLVAAILALVAGCGGDPGSGSSRPLVIATTTVLGDLVANVVGPDADVEVLLPIGADPHDFQLSSRQAARLREADLVVAIGLGLEEGLGDTLAAAAADGVPVLEIGPAVDPLQFGGLDGTGDDPHVWMDPLRMARASEILGATLESLVPGDWVPAAAAYASALRDLDAEVRDLVDQIPPARRVLVTNHDALGYFARRYGFEVVGVIVPGGSTLGEPSSAELAALVGVVRAAGVPAIFAETTEPTALAAAIADEAGGGVVVVELFTGSLGPPGSGAETLVGLIRTDARRIIEALS